MFLLSDFKTRKHLTLESLKSLLPTLSLNDQFKVRIPLGTLGEVDVCLSGVRDLIEFSKIVKKSKIYLEVLKISAVLGRNHHNIPEDSKDVKFFCFEYEINPVGILDFKFDVNHQYDEDYDTADENIIVLETEDPTKPPSEDEWKNFVENTLPSKISEIGTKYKATSSGDTYEIWDALKSAGCTSKTALELLDFMTDHQNFNVMIDSKEWYEPKLTISSVDYSELTASLIRPNLKRLRWMLQHLPEDSNVLISLKEYEEVDFEGWAQDSATLSFFIADTLFDKIGDVEVSDDQFDDIYTYDF